MDEQTKENGGLSVGNFTLLGRAKQMVWAIRAIESDCSLTKNLTRCSFGAGLLAVEGRINNTKLRITCAREFYHEVTNYYKQLKNNSQGVEVPTKEITKLLETKGDFRVCDEITGRIPSWCSISTEFPDNNRKAFAWRFAHSILPKWAHPPNTKHILNKYNISGGRESL